MYKFFLFFIFLISSTYLAIEVKYSNLTFNKIQTNNKVWKHRGGTPENSLSGISKSLTEGYQGIEIDINYDDKIDKFIVDHDYDHESSKAKTLTLQEVLTENRVKDVKWWLDLKNLKNDNYQKVLKLLKSIEDKYDLNDKYFIESDQFIPLRALANASIPSVYWINPHSKSRIHYLRIVENKIKLIFSNFIGVSIYYESYDTKAKKYLSHINKFIFTVNGKGKEIYINDPTVNIVLTDD
tara:strand:- start:2060 stop:2776 length:717 start_codon:yes stop_codon:yes gene_type:complete